MLTPSKSAVLRGVVIAVVLVTVAFVALRVTTVLDELDSVPSVRRPELLIGALLCYAGALLGFALLWRTVVFRLDGARPAAMDSVAVFLASWLGRYVPSSLVYMAGKFALGLRLGHRRAALAASLVYENVFLVAVGGISSSIVISLLLTGVVRGPWVFVGVAMGGVVCLALISPPAFRRVVNVLLHVVRRGPIAAEHVLSFRGMLAASVVTLGALTMSGASFAFVLSSFIDVTGRELVAAGAIFVLAGVAGIAALPVPSGLGVREAVLVGLLHLFVPVEIAAAAAVVSRLTTLSVDVTLGLVGMTWLTLRGRRASVAQSAVAAQRQLDAA